MDPCQKVTREFIENVREVIKWCDNSMEDDEACFETISELETSFKMYESCQK